MRKNRFKKFAPNRADVSERVGIVFETADQNIMLSCEVRVAPFFKKGELIQEYLIIDARIVSKKRSPH